MIFSGSLLVSSDFDSGRCLVGCGFGLWWLVVILVVILIGCIVVVFGLCWLVVVVSGCYGFL